MSLVLITNLTFWPVLIKFKEVFRKSYSQSIQQERVSARLQMERPKLHLAAIGFRLFAPTV